MQERLFRRFGVSRDEANPPHLPFGESETGRQARLVGSFVRYGLPMHFFSFLYRLCTSVLVPAKDVCGAGMGVSRFEKEGIGNGVESSKSMQSAVTRSIFL